MKMEDNKHDKRYKSEKKLEIEWINTQVWGKRKGFYGGSKNSSVINSKPPNSAPASASTTSVKTTTNTNVTDYDQTPSTSAVNITRTNDEVELPDVTDNNKSMLVKKQG